MSKNRKRVKSQSQIDIALLSCGLVDLKVFQECVDAIEGEAQESGAQVYLYLNGAPKESKGDFLDYVPSTWKLKQSSERVGFPAGANRTIRSGNAPLVLFITDDVILHKGSVAKLVDRMKGDEKIGVCGMKLLFPEDSTDPGRPAGRVQHIGHGIDIRGKVTHPLLGWKSDNPKCNNSREVLSVTGGVFMVRRKAFMQAGGFWEGYGMGYYEDIDLNLAIRENGWKIWIETEATATHYTNMSMLRSETPPNMQRNEPIFLARRQHLLVHDSWTFWILAGIILVNLHSII